eukprot:1120830-Pyramimonas_sp.AAC.1
MATQEVPATPGPAFPPGSSSALPPPPRPLRTEDSAAKDETGATAATAPVRFQKKITSAESLTRRERAEGEEEVE